MFRKNSMKESSFSKTSSTEDKLLKYFINKIIWKKT